MGFSFIIIFSPVVTVCKPEVHSQLGDLYFLFLFYFFQNTDPSRQFMSVKKKKQKTHVSVSRKYHLTSLSGIS